jgi:NIMA (never in mitosis gene a)-related kinase
LLQHFLNAKKILHRDIKLENIFLIKKGQAKLGDFDIGRSLNSTHQMVKTLAGTVYYMAPEVVQRNLYSFSVDIWSFGCVMYQLIMRKLPFVGKNIFELSKKIVEGKYPPLEGNYSQN